MEAFFVVARYFFIYLHKFMCMKTTFYLLILSFVIFFSSCEISQEYDIKKDLSGNYKLTIDFSELAKDDSSILDKKKTDVDKFNKVINILKKVQGLTNLKYDFGNKDGLISYSYDFADLNSLNSALEESSVKVLSFPEVKIKKGFMGKIIYTRNKLENIDKKDSKINFSNLITYKTILSFDNDIKKVKSSGDDNYKIEKNKIIEKGDFSEMFSKNRKFKISIKK